MDLETQSILFFDGNCGLCSRSVNFLRRRDHEAKLRFAPLQGSTAGALLPAELRTDLNTVVYKRAESRELYIKSDAALLALIDSGSAWRIPARLAHVLPRGMRNWLYDCIANNRHRLFKKKTCPLPTEEAGQRFLP